VLAEYTKKNTNLYPINLKRLENIKVRSLKHTALSAYFIAGHWYCVKG
jgi:hypothetical protein